MGCVNRLRPQENIPLLIYSLFQVPCVVKLIEVQWI